MKILSIRGRIADRMSETPNQMKPTKGGGIFAIFTGLMNMLGFHNSQNRLFYIKNVIFRYYLRLSPPLLP